MYCIHCGSVIENHSKFCAYCGGKINVSDTPLSDPSPNKNTGNSDPTQIVDSFSQIGEGYCCPHCGNSDLQIVNEVDVQTSGGGYSGGKGCLGFLLFGPLGLLCGNCGQSQKTTTTNTNYFLCGRCGNKFRNPKDLKQESEKEKAIGVVLLFFGLIIGITSLILFLVPSINIKENSSLMGITIAMIIISCSMLFGGIIGLVSGSGKNSEAKRIIDGMLRYNPSLKSVFDDILNPMEDNSYWTCRYCQNTNPDYTERCTHCGSQREKETGFETTNENHSSQTNG